MSSSSKRHWPSMFKSKPCNTLHPWHRHRDITIKQPSLGEERITAEPKARWNPKPEQIRILEAIFNSGMVNPPRDEIRNIRAKLQEYGQVGDANVFYWFQNRKSRTKHKLRHLQTSTDLPPPTTQNTEQHPAPTLLISPSPNENDSVNHHHNICRAPTGFTSDQTVENSPNLLLTQLQGCAAVPPPSGGVTGTPKSTVIINGLALEVAAVHFNVKAAFGDDAVLVHYSSGQPLLTTECGVTLVPLQDGDCYYLLRT